MLLDLKVKSSTAIAKVRRLMTIKIGLAVTHKHVDLNGFICHAFKSKESQKSHGIAQNVEKRTKAQCYKAKTCNA